MIQHTVPSLRGTISVENWAGSIGRKAYNTGGLAVTVNRRGTTVLTKKIRFYSVNGHAHEPRKATAPASGF